MAGEIAPDHDPTAQKSLVGERVLVCEDEGITHIMITRVLTHAGLKVVGSAITGKQAVEIALRERPALILLDVDMPEMDGIEAMERILAVYQPCIVMLSAYDGDTRQKARAKGARGYINKPVNCESLLHDLEVAYQAC